MKHRRRWVSSSVVLLFLLVLMAGYAGWNAANPERTCASCHEITPSLEVWQQSAHREVTCADCHGTTLGNGFHSLKEKTGMLFSHLKKQEQPSRIRWNEEEVLGVTESCKGCS